MKIINKVTTIILIIGILFSNFVPLINIHASGETYSVKILKSDGSTSINKGNFSTYSAAKTEMLKHASTASEVAVIYNGLGKLVSAKYAMVKLHTKAVIPLYPTATSTAKFTSVASDHGRDAAFIDYDPVSNRVKIKISGYAGWTHIDNVQIIPIIDLNSNFIKIEPTDSPPRVRTSTDTTNTDNQIGNVHGGEVHRYYEKKAAGGYTWYRIIFNGQVGWVASLPGWTREINIGLQTYYEANTEGGNLIHYFEHEIRNSPITQSYTNLGTYPSFMTANKIYYSFDGNYFYNNLLNMLDDYRENKVARSLNKDKPHFAYYLYLPTHSKTGYTANDFNQNIKNNDFTRNMDPAVTYVRKVVDSNGNPILNSKGQIEWEWVPGINRSGISLLYNEGQSLVDVANKYGINALMMFGAATNESGNGTSLIAFLKKNLFGLGANDSDPVNGAHSYQTVKESMEAFARLTTNDYSNPNDGLYHGSHYGNKASGMNIMYATDPYWGEKQARDSRNVDKSFGLNDFMANTIGVKLTNEAVPVMKEPKNNSAVIYNMRNSYDLVEKMPLIVFDKVYTTENNVTTGWYKVYTDASLDSNQNININVPYTFDNSYGYVREDKMFVANNQPIITATDITIKQNQPINLLTGVKALDIEDGDLTGKIEVTGEVDNSKTGTYKITYRVEDNNRFQGSKEITVTVLPGDAPIISASNKTVSQFTVFDPKVGVTANDYNDGNLTTQIKVVNNAVDTTKLGDYKVLYEVTNSIGKTTQKEITITVGPNAKPVINASNKTIKVGDSFDPLAGVTATDKEDGVITPVVVVSNAVDASKPGTYKVVLTVTDKANNVVTKEIYVTVEEINYINKNGDFYFEKMEFNKTTNKLDVAGYLAIKGINNTKNDNIKYDFIIKDNFNNKEIIKPLERWLSGNPTRSYNDGIYNYSATWFKGSIDLSDINSGEYTLYVRARLNNYQSINLFRNVLGKSMVRKVQDSNGIGYVFRNNNYSKNYPIELFVNKKGLISSMEPPHSSNMFNSYKTLSFNGKYLNIDGNSYNINGDYGSTKTIERSLILENIVTEDRFVYNIGSYVGSEIPLKSSDGKSKVRGWFNTTGKVDISNIPVGKYKIYIKTKSGNVEDHGELNDIFLKKISATTTVNNKHYSVELNKAARFRLELNVKNVN